MIAPIYKKDNTSRENDSGISLVSIAFRQLARISLRQLSSAHEDCMRKNQAGFQLGRDDVGQTSTLGQIPGCKPTISVLQLRAKLNLSDHAILGPCFSVEGVPEVIPQTKPSWCLCQKWSSLRFPLSSFLSNDASKLPHFFNCINNIVAVSGILEEHGERISSITHALPAMYWALRFSI